jgi:hypothetical protein
MRRRLWWVPVVVVLGVYAFLAARTLLTIQMGHVLSSVLAQNEESEARSWLAENKNPSALASNRFGTTQKAAAFVDALYDAGAPRVKVSGILSEPSRIQREGGPYADTLVVTLPGNPVGRIRLFWIAGREAVRQMSLPVVDVGQSSITLWWD